MYSEMSLNFPLAKNTTLFPQGPRRKIFQILGYPSSVKSHNPFHGVGLKSNREAIGDSHNVCTTVLLVYHTDRSLL